ncbi:hypothetical protein GFER_08375 [Geoalkalibacter ferrihydriticus DSM 17813]|uniref:Uncharacterized protein n=1 Tax=Geoalkalibacter ferrihydriticus DSM 17813 TaxID=1121915 RepID=A0A0C2EEJ6_9BACT|nr:hypothetical protein [Geoalkalibacter ferrihydriticus]KIH77048.1 hypothetical protein GFER_08375 [Geoalkalibacter ferrihydriticus DSM 17813]
MRLNLYRIRKIDLVAKKSIDLLPLNWQYAPPLPRGTGRKQPERKNDLLKKNRLTQASGIGYKHRSSQASEGRGLQELGRKKELEKSS